MRTTWGAGRGVAGLVLAVGLAGAAFAGDAPADKERADAAFQAENWAEAAAAYEARVAAHPEDGTSWFRLGMSRVSLGRHAEAVTAFEQALGHGFNPVIATFRIARSQAAAGQPDAALATLRQLATQGRFRGVANQLGTLEEFAALRGRPEFATVVADLTPCAAPEYRHFDFWLGDWIVQDPQGNVVGANLVTERLDGCALTEEWTSQSGGRGMSLNYFDARDDTWNQIYIDNTGAVGNWPPLKGRLEDGVMTLRSPDDAQPRTRWMWTAVSKDKVRQWAESSPDGGKTWSTVWDSYYVRRGTAAAGD